MSCKWPANISRRSSFTPGRLRPSPRPEAYALRGWTYSCLGDYQRAIAECREAIKVDPEFGNPYNDIGAYLIEQGKWEEAIPWFKQATDAKRWEARCYPCN